MCVERRSIFTRNGGRTRSRRATLLEWSATQSPMVARGERPKRVVHEMDGRHRRAVPCTTEVFGVVYLLPCFTKALHRSFHGRRSHTVHNDLYSAYRADVRTRVTCRGIYPSGTLYFHSAEHLHHLKIRALDGLAVRRGQGLQLSLLQETVSQGSALRARQ